MSALKDDEISQRMFYGGMLGLPWLWIAHTLEWYGKQRPAPSLLDDEEQDAVSAAIKEKEATWVRRCRNSAFIVSVFWVAWILLAQLFLVDMLPESWYIRTPDQGDYTGW